MLPDPKEQPTLSVDEAAALCGISRASAYRAAKDGTLPTIRFGRTVRVVTQSLLSLLGHPSGPVDGLDGGSGVRSAPAPRPLREAG